MVYERFASRGVRGDYRKKEIFSEDKKQKRKISIRFKIPFLSYIKTFLYVLFIAVILYFIIFSSIFQVKQVNIEGVKSTEISDYINKSLLGKNIILFSPGKYLTELTGKYPIIEEARIVRGLPSTLKVSVLERKQLLVWCAVKCFELDTRGSAYQEIPKPSDRIVLLDRSNIEGKIGDQLVPERFIDFYLKALDQLDGLGLKISDSYIDDTTFKLTFKTSDGWEAIFDTSGSLANQIDALKQTLDKNRSDIKQYVDLRVEGVVYIK